MSNEFKRLVPKSALVATTLVAISVTGIGALVIDSRASRAEHQQVLEKNATINLRPSTRFKTTDVSGQELHTLCTGGGWCVTDRVPPEEVERAPTHTFPTIDIASICQFAAKENDLKRACEELKGAR